MNVRNCFSQSYIYLHLKDIITILLPLLYVHTKTKYARFAGYIILYKNNFFEVSSVDFSKPVAEVYFTCTVYPKIEMLQIRKITIVSYSFF